MAPRAANFGVSALPTQRAPPKTRETREHQKILPQPALRGCGLQGLRTHASLRRNMPESQFEMMERHLAARRKMIDASRWRKKQLQLGLSMAQVLSDPETASIVDELEAYPEETNEIRDRRRAEDQMRIRRENREQRIRLAYMRPTIDDDTEDDATGIARAEARAESANTRREEAIAISIANKAHRMRLAAVKARTDDDVTDDAAGFARARVAAESNRRKQQEQQRIATDNAAYARRIARVQAVTDN